MKTMLRKFVSVVCALSISVAFTAQAYEVAPDIVIFDFDNIDPVLDYTDAVHQNYLDTGPDTIIKVTNPNKDAVNSSDWVGQYDHRSPRQYEGVYFNPQPDSKIYNTIELKYLIPPGVKGRIQYKVLTNDNFPDTTYNVVLYPTTPTAARFFEPIEGDGQWHELSIEIPSSNKIRALAIGFNSDWSPGGKNPDNEEQVNPDLSGTVCYFDDLKLKATESEFHTLYFEQFDTPTPYWATNTTNENCPSMNGGIQPVSSIDNVIFTQLWTGELYNNLASFFRIPKGSHVDFFNIPTAGYNDYEINIDFGNLNAASGDASYGVTTYMNVLYRESGTLEWNELESGVIEYDKFSPYHTAIQYDGMKAMDLRISVDEATCSVHLNKIEITGAWNGGASAIKAPKNNAGKAYYSTTDQSVIVESDAKIEVFGIDGSLSIAAPRTSTLHLNTLPKGIYVAKISTNEGYEVLKFLK
ncbi:MAG: T9SS type A sorting domain-containing protein [Dysgonamonadaceae bacterium]|jgi:hypothetical protein|nr:T9SS type A sorting domain-containing protein [Dysgonamonadaceae bacterium]